MTTSGPGRSRQRRPLAVGVWLAVGPKHLTTFARRAEEAGCESLWTGEHLVWPVEINSRHPYSPSGGTDFHGAIPLSDPWVNFAVAAAVTTTIRLGTAVYILPLRHPLVTARSVATLDTISGGRAILGAGIGWLAEEYQACGLDFSTRASRNDEIVPLLRALWSEEVVEHHGRHFDIPPVYFEPKPPQGGSLPIMFGGMSAPALRRAARLADGWIGAWEDTEVVVDLIGRLREQLTVHERDHDNFEITLMVGPDDISHDHLQMLHDIGVDRVIVGSPGLRTAEWMNILDRVGPIIDKLQNLG